MSNKNGIKIQNVEYGSKDIRTLLALEFVLWANEMKNIGILLKD